MAKIKTLRNVLVDGKHVDANQITECSDTAARTLISMGKAVIAPDANNSDEKAAAKAKKAAAKAAKKSTSTPAANQNTIASQDVIDAVLALDEDDDNNYDADMCTPKLDVISALVGRDVTADELHAALQVIDEKPAAE